MVFFYLQELVAMAVFCSLEIMEIEFSVQILEVAVFRDVGIVLFCSLDTVEIVS